MPTLREMQQRKEARKCPFCIADTTNASFKDDLSEREYESSGLCQKCQDDFFNGGGTSDEAAAIPPSPLTPAKTELKEIT